MKVVIYKDYAKTVEQLMLSFIQNAKTVSLDFQNETMIEKTRLHIQCSFGII